MRKILLGLIIATCLSGASAQKKGSSKNSPSAPTSHSIAAFTNAITRTEGYFNYFYDDAKDKLYLEIDLNGRDFLYVNSLAAGIGSNDIGLDRGQLGNERIVRFEKHGQKLMLMQPNQDYRAVSQNPDEVKSVQEAFASSILWGFSIVAQNDTHYLIDLSDFLLRDSHRISNRLAQTKQGNYKIDPTRSALHQPNIMNFPQNTEFEATLTFTGEPIGAYIRSVAPSADAVTVRTHHSFIQLPDDKYVPRDFDPRSGFYNISFQDYATPVASSLVKRFIARHRLEKLNPEFEKSEVIEPIIYYLDRGAPEPIRSALMEGAQWWNQAFEAAGFINAFQVKLLPIGAHPMDIRYNMIQWVHRSTRGWSYGSSVVDPRTGEIIKGQVSLGSLRVRQDFLIAQGLLNEYSQSNGPLMALVLARLRQLAAHEVGHTLGIMHNYAASSNNRASVMDYPHPLVKLTSAGEIDLSDAYDINIGEWDIAAIKFGYTQFTKGTDESSALNEIIKTAHREGLLYITDRDARAANGAHPVAHLWDGGASATNELNRMMAVREKVLLNLSDNSLPKGEPYSSLEEILVPMYLFHRYQIEAASKVIGGLDYTYSVKGDDQLKTALLDPSLQIDALQALINTLQPKALMLPKKLLIQIPPKAPGYNRGRESFISKTGPVFDYYSAVETAAEMSLTFLLNAERANRLVMYNDLDANQPGLSKVLNLLLAQTWKKPNNNPEERAIQRIVEWQVVEKLMHLRVNTNAQTDVQSITEATLNDLSAYCKLTKASNSEDAAHYARISSTIDAWLEAPGEITFPNPLKAPDGSPIGQDEDFLNYCGAAY